MGLVSLANSMKYGSSGHGFGGGFASMLGGNYGSRGFDDLLIGGSGFGPDFLRQSSTSNLSINPFGFNNPIGGFFSEIGRFIFGAKHQVDGVFHMSGRPSSGFNLGDEFGGALREEISKLGGGLMSQGARLGQFNADIGDFRVYGRANPIQNFLQDIGGIFNR